MRRIPLLLFSALLLTSLPVFSANPRTEASTAIRRVLDEQVESWNRHDLEKFMQGYWHSPDLTFFSGAKVYRGWDAALERYKKTYQAEGREMGRLEFSDLQITPLGQDAAFVRGAYHLTMSGGKQPHGIFTLVLLKFADGWKVVHDHTAPAE